MAGELPPSKFGAGTTYGDSGRSYPPPQAASPPPPPPPPPPPSYAPAPDPYATTGYATAPPPTSSSAPQYSAPPAYSYPAATGAAPAARGAGGGTAAIAAAILGLIGAIWYGVDVVRSWDDIDYLFKSLDGLSNLGVSGSVAFWAYGAIAAVIAEFAFVVLLLLGGILLLARSSAGRVMVVLGSLLVIATNIYWILAAFKAVDWLNSFAGSAEVTGSTGEFLGRVLLNAGLPALLGLVTLILAMTASAKRWCQRVTAVTY